MTVAVAQLEPLEGEPQGLLLNDPVQPEYAVCPTKLPGCPGQGDCVVVEAKEH